MPELPLQRPPVVTLVAGGDQLQQVSSQLGYCGVALGALRQELRYIHRRRSEMAEVVRTHDCITWQAEDVTRSGERTSRSFLHNVKVDFQGCKHRDAHTVETGLEDAS